MATQMQAVAVVLLLAALAYLLYIWSRRRDQIECPSCGATVDMYEDECPHCGHEKGAPLEDEADDADETADEAPEQVDDAEVDDDTEEDEDVAADTAGEAVGTADEVHVEADHRTSLSEAAEKPAEPDAMEEPDEPDAAAETNGGPEGGPEPDFEQLVSDHTVDEVKERVETDDLDPEAVLDAEQANKDRVTLTRWLEERIDA